MLLVHTPTGLPGFDTARDWVLEGDDTRVFSLLRNLEEPSIGLLVTQPWDLAPGYEPDLPDEELTLMGVDGPGDVSLYVVATIAGSATEDGARTVLLNLAAPIVLHNRTGIARQVILDRQGWPLRHPVVARDAAAHSVEG